MAKKAAIKTSVVVRDMLVTTLVEGLGLGWVGLGFSLGGKTQTRGVVVLCCNAQKKYSFLQAILFVRTIDRISQKTTRMNETSRSRKL